MPPMAGRVSEAGSGTGLAKASNWNEPAGCAPPTTSYFI